MKTASSGPFRPPRSLAAGERVLVLALWTGGLVGACDRPIEPGALDLHNRPADNSVAANTDLGAADSGGATGDSADPLIEPVAADSGTLLPSDLAPAPDSIKATACTLVLPEAPEDRVPPCYAPGIDYENHPDWSQEGSVINPAQPGKDGKLPEGDTGLWSEMGTVDGVSHACAYAVIASAVSAGEKTTTAALASIASLSCLLQEQTGGALPGAAATDLTQVAQLALASTAPAVVVDKVSAQTITDGQGNPVQAYVVNTTRPVAGGGLSRVEIQLRLRIDGPNAQSLKVAAVVMPPPGQGGPAGAADGYAAWLSLTKSEWTAPDDSRVRVAWAGGRFPSAASNNPLLADGSLDPLVQWMGVYRNNYEADPVAHQYRFSRLWVPSAADLLPRVFRATGDPDPAPGAAGCGYSGFGGSATNLGQLAPITLPPIDRFICNLAGPGANTMLSAQVGKAQKQCFVTTGAKGPVVPTTTQIAYAPVSSCDSSPASHPGFRFKADWEASYPSPQPTVVNQLIVLATDPDYPQIVDPAAPQLDF
jgi:hypothetical protein